MNTFIGINNVERFGDQLCSAADPARRATLMRLLVEEEDNLGAGLEQLDAAELRIARCHQLIASQRVLVARIGSDGHDAEEANTLLSALLEVQELFEGYRRRILSALNQRSL